MFYRSFALLFVSLISGMSVAKSRSQLQLVLNGQEQLVSDSVELTLKKIQLSHKTLYISNYLRIEQDGKNLVLKRKKKIFKDLFADDKDPYTQEIFKRSLCLTSETDDQILFLSGGNLNWANCHKANKSFKKSDPSVRQWLYCASTLWEVTGIDISSSDLSLKCAKN